VAFVAPPVVPPVVVPPVVVLVVVLLVPGVVALRDVHGCHTNSPIRIRTTTMTATMMPVLLFEVLELL